MIRRLWSEMSYAQRALAVLALALFVGVFKWACVARITYDEGYMLDVIAHFPADHVMQVVYDGRWGTRWVVTTGPTVSVPLGILAAFGGVNVVVARLCVFLAFAFMFWRASRLAGLTARATLSAVAIFLLWVLCLVWRPDLNGSSINLIANVFGEGTSFALALLTCVLAAREERKYRDWAWVCGMLSAGAKIVGIVAVAVPLAYLLWRGLKTRSLKLMGARGLAIAAALWASWQLWIIWWLGWREYRNDWKGLFYWLGHGGGYHATADGGFTFTFLQKMQMMELSHVDPLVVLGLTLLAVGAIVAARRLARAKTQPTLSRRTFQLVAGAAALFYAWFIFLSGRGWMRHLWIGYALLGWLAAALLAQLLERKPLRRAWLAPAAYSALLFVVAFVYGTLPALGPMGPTEVWFTQRDLARELSEKFPYSRLMVADWRAVPYIAFFMQRRQKNLFEIQPVPGDLILCDTESGCDESVEKLCTPTMTDARVAWCLYTGPQK